LRFRPVAGSSVTDNTLLFGSERGNERRPVYSSHGPARRIILLHLLPNALGPVLVTATITVAGAILTESALSFLGFGVQPPDATWGNILADGRAYIFDAPWLFFIPGIAILVVVLAFNLVGEGIREASDPRLRRQ
jgi:peptide/nickel transport system permease protein